MAVVDPFVPLRECRSSLGGKGVSAHFLSIESQKYAYPFNFPDTTFRAWTGRGFLVDLPSLGKGRSGILKMC